MKTLRQNFTLLLCVCALMAQTACSAFKSSATVAQTVDLSMNLWGDYVRAGKATPEQETKVKAVYEKYQATSALARKLVHEYMEPTPGTIPDPDAFNKAFNMLDSSKKEVIAIVDLFTKGTK